MKELVKTIVFVAIALFAVGLGGGAALAGGITVQMDQPFVVGDRVLPAGEVAILPTLHSGYMALFVDGRQLGVLQRTDSGYGTEFATPRLVFERDRTGVLHLMRIRYSAPSGFVTRVIHLEAAALSASLPQQTVVAQASLAGLR